MIILHQIVPNDLKGRTRVELITRSKGLTWSTKIPNPDLVFKEMEPEQALTVIENIKKAHAEMGSVTDGVTQWELE